MTYKEMTVEQIAEVIKMYEADVYSTLKLYERAFGDDDELTRGKRKCWSALYDLCTELGINTVD